MTDDVSEIRNHFLMQAHDYDEQTEWRQNEQILGCIEELFGRVKGMVIDVGTGTGLVGQRISRHADFTIGVDISGEMLKIAKRRIDCVIEANICQLPFRSASVDCCTMRQVLHYTDDKKVMREISRILKNDGSIILADTIVENESDIALWKQIRKLVQPLRRRVYDINFHSKLLNEIGFSVDKQQYLKIWRNDSWDAFFKHVPSNTSQRRKVLELLKLAAAGGVTFPVSMNKGGVRYLQSWLVTRAKRTST